MTKQQGKNTLTNSSENLKSVRAELYHLEIPVQGLLEYIQYLRESADVKPKDEIEFMKLAEDGIAYILSQNISMLATGLVEEIGSTWFNTINLNISFSNEIIKETKIDHEGVMINPKKIDVFKTIATAKKKLKEKK